MSTPETNDEVSRPAPEEPPAAKARAATSNERKRRRRERREAAEVAEAAEAAPPMTRREMRARGILLTTEVPVVEAPPDWPAQAGAGDTGAPPEATEPTFDRESEERAQEPEAVTTASVAAVGAAPGNPPMTRRQMRALTGEIGRVTQAQAVPAPEASETPGEAATPAEETPSSAPEAEAEAAAETEPEPASETELSIEPEPESEATAKGQEAAPSAAVPSRRAMRDRLRDAPPPSAEAPAERTVTGRRPVVRTPVTARGVRTVDESGAISAVQPVVPPPVAWAPTGEQPTVPPQPAVAPVPEWTTSPSSWESAVSMPAIVMGIEDRKEPPTGGVPITPPRTELADSALPSVSRQSLMAGSPAEPGRSRGLPGTAGRPQAPEATAAWSSLIDEQEASARRDEQEASVRRAAEALAVAEQQSAAEGGQRRERRSGRGGEHDAEEMRGRGLLRIVILVAIGLAIGALIYLLATGALGSLFAEGAGTPASGVAVAGLLAGGARLTKEFRDR